MVKESDGKLAYQRGLFRYGVISELLSRPPGKGELAARLREITNKTFRVPWQEKPIQLSLRTLERWYAGARQAERPSEVLQPKIRKDRGLSRVLQEEHLSWLRQYRLKYPSWSVQLLFDNLVETELKRPFPSYSTVLRHVRAQYPHIQSKTNKKRKTKEIRSFEVEYVGQLWHMDFHKGSRYVITENGEYKQPICMAIIDDKSRLVCHVQWFFQETAEVLVHGFLQAVLKRGLPRTFYTDNGSAMKAEEFKAGLIALDIRQEYTLPYSPHQNGKQESFWQPLEGRLIKMLPPHKPLTLDVLNACTQAWVEQDYHYRVHVEIQQTPRERFFSSKNVLRETPDYKSLKSSFRMKVTRQVRKTDATLTLDGVRFQLPQCYAHMEALLLRYARWDLAEAEILCPDTHKSLCTIYPLNKIANSAAFRAEIEPSCKDSNEVPSATETCLDLTTDHLPPLLARCLKERAQECSLSGYLPLNTKNKG